MVEPRAPASPRGRSAPPLQFLGDDREDPAASAKGPAQPLVLPSLLVHLRLLPAPSGDAIVTGDNTGAAVGVTSGNARPARFANSSPLVPPSPVRAGPGVRFTAVSTR